MSKLGLLVAFAFGAAACTADATSPEEANVPAPEVGEVSTESVSGCVSIQWCNAPGAIGTVCQVKASCQSQCGGSAIYTECHNQARAVCGTIVQPFDIVCNH